jgi:hypothetical protein
MSGWNVGQPSRSGLSRPAKVGVAVAVVAAVLILLALGGTVATNDGTHSGPSYPLSFGPATPPPTATGATTTGTCPTGIAACASGDGVTVLVSNIDRNFQPQVPSFAASFAVPEHGFHWLRIEVTVMATEGQQHLEPFNFDVKDAIGQDGPDLGAVDDPRCQMSAAGGIYGPGEGFGPFPLCFQVAGPVDGPLTLIWFPTALTGPQSVVQVRLP